MASSSKLLLPSTSSSGELPPDALFEALVRIPSKDLCRLCAVCRSWRALTSDPLFVAAHTARHPEPLLAVDYRDLSNSQGVDILNSSGKVLRRIPISGGDDLVILSNSGEVLSRIPSSADSIIMVRTCLDLVCFTRLLHPLGLWVLNPTTGATLALPERRSEEFVVEQGGVVYTSELYAFGKVSMTGEYKALRVTNIKTNAIIGADKQLCEIITVGGGTNHGMWRGMQAPPAPIHTGDEMRSVVIDGVAYFSMEFQCRYFGPDVIDVEPGSIASFNLETEEWMETIRGPVPVRRFLEPREDGVAFGMQLSLADLHGCLVTVHNINKISVDLWFLIDLEKGLWVKKYSLGPQVAWPSVYPFLVLNDGKILLRHGMEYLQSYDPKTGTRAIVKELIGSGSVPVGTYTGSPLSLYRPCH